jgi:N utilization substance protein B
LVRIFDCGYGRLDNPDEHSLVSSGKWARRKARRALVQAVYQWQMAGGSASAIETEFQTNGSLDKADVPFFKELLRGVVLETAAVDELLQPALDRPAAELTQVERAVLRVATRELSERVDVPYRVVIDEYVELTKLFGAEEGHKYVNGVLDQLARSLRPQEVAAHGRV